MNSKNRRDNNEESPEFVTSISRVSPGKINIRGFDGSDLIRYATASEGAFLTIRGRRPTDSELRIFDAILCSCVDHGLVNTLSVAARYVVSGSNSLPAAIASGVLCFGSYTGSSNFTAEMLIDLSENHGQCPDDRTIDNLVRRYRKEGQPVPGLGHPIHREQDPRTKAVREIAEMEGLIGPSVELLDRIRARCSMIVGRDLVLNVDGFIGALLLDMGFSPKEILATNILAAIPGIAAHAIEESNIGQRLRYPLDHESCYALPPETRTWERSLPADTSTFSPE